MRVVLAATACFTLSLHATGDGLVLARGGKAEARIVLPADPTPAERYAGEELAAHLKAMGGAEIPVGAAADAGGAGGVLRLVHDPALGPETYRLKAEPAAKTLTIAGGRPRGVLYGVYGLLEDVLGCRWYTRDCARVPRRDPLEVPAALDVRVTPRLEYREPFWTEAFDGTWAARNRANSNSARLEDRHGGKVAYGTFVHTFNAILDPAKHFKDHPEWFSMVKGVRIPGHTQLCLTNPEVLRIAIERVREWIAAHPKAAIFSVSQNDWHNPCACPACKALDDAEGSHAGTLIRFVNAVAEAIEKDHPGVAIDTLAYQYTRKPPKTAVPRPNVIVRLCSIECCFAHPLDGCPEKTNTSFLEDLKGWSRLTKRLYVWDYVTNFSHYLLPFPNLDVLDRNIRTLAGHGVVGIFEQGNYSGGGGGELSELRAWVLAKLLWDPSRDGNALIREFVEGAFGPAAPKVQAFLDLQREAIRTSGEHVRIFDGVTRGYLSVETLRACDALLEEAERAAAGAGDPALLARVLRLRMPIWYARVWQAREPVEALQPAAARLLEAAKNQKLTHFREHAGVAQDLERLALTAARRPVRTEPGAIAGEDSAFGLYQEGTLVSLVADPKAEDGVAARQVGRGTDWSIQWPIPVPAGARPGPYRVRARIRIDKAGETGPAFHVGVYDKETRKGVGEVRVQAKEMPDGEYRWIDVCELELKLDRIVYVAPDDNAANVTGVYTDRIELVPAAR